MQTITVNQNGLQAIRTILSVAHVQSEFTDSMVASWASDVENSWAEGNDAAFEIPANKSISGRPVVYTLPANMYDVAEIED